MENENKKGLNTILICVIVVLLVVIGYFVYITYIKDTVETNNNNENSNEVSNTENNTTKELVKEYDESKASIYYSYIYPTNLSSVYKSTKVSVSGLSDEFMLYNAINNLCENNESSKTTKEFLVDTLKSRILSMYGVEVKSLPSYLMDYSDQSYSYDLVNNNYVVRDEGYGYACHHEKYPTTMFEYIESNDEYVYLHDKLILNSEFSNSGEGTISKFDNSNKITVSTDDAKELYSKYPEYFTSYTHTFKKTNGKVVYVSTEPTNID